MAARIASIAWESRHHRLVFGSIANCKRPGVPIIVVEARDMRVSLSTMRNKIDRNDARGIAQMMRLGWYRAVHVKTIDMQKMRSLLANRQLLKRKLSTSKTAPRAWWGYWLEPSLEVPTKHAFASCSNVAIRFSR
jgi:hypothetical protein